MQRKDYCGPFWMPSFLRRWVSDKFNASCKVHDLDYESGKYSRREADQRFLRHMLRQSNSSGTDILAAIFFIAVCIGGWISYKRK